MVDGAADPSATRPGPQRPDRLHQLDGTAVWAVAAASAVAGGLTSVHPTGNPTVDAVYGALLAGAVAAAGGLAGRATVLWLTAVVAGFSRGYVIFPALASLVLAFAATVSRRPLRSVNALSAALAVQVALRLPHTGFQGGSALVAGVAVAPCLLNAAARLPRVARRVVVGTTVGGVFLALLFSVPVAVEAALSRSDAAVGTTAAEDALRSVSDGNASGGTAQLQAAHADFASVAQRLGAWWAAGARLVPVVSQQRKAALAGAQVARDVTQAAGQEAGQIDFARLHYAGGGIDLAQVAALQQPLGRVDGLLTSGLRRLRASESGWLVQPLRSRLSLVTSKVAKAQSSASLADQAVAAAPSLFGGEGVRHYAVVFMDPSESRGLGGLIASYGLITASAGHLSLGQFQDISILNTQLIEHGGGRITGPPDYLARYGQNPATFAQNVTYSPDLPTVTTVLGQLFAESGTGPLDGVLVVDSVAIGSLLNFSGSVDVAGIGKLTSANAQDVLERAQYAAFPSPRQQTQRRAVLADAMKEALSRLTGGTLPGPLSLSQALDPDVRSGDLLFWSTHPADQPLLARIGMAGSFPRADGGDLLGVVASNAGANKIDAYLQRTVTDTVRYDRSTGQVSSTVEVTLHNEAPAQGLSSEVIGSYTGSRLSPGTNRLWLSVYSPLQLAGAQLDGRALTTAALPELGVETYSAFLSIPAGSTVTVTFQLKGTVHSGRYGLHIYSQPTAIPTRTNITFTDNRGQTGQPTVTWAPKNQSRAYRIF